MRKILSVIPVALLALFAAHDAMAQERGRKMLRNTTQHTITLDIGIRQPDTIVRTNNFQTSELKTIQMLPGQNQWFEYNGTYLNFVRVSGPVNCNVTVRNSGDYLDNTLNMNSFLTIEPQGESCKISGSNW